MWVEILDEELFKPEIDGIPSSIKPSSSIADYKPMKGGPELLKNSPAIKTVQAELDERKARLKDLEDSGKYPNHQESHRTRIAELEKSLKKAKSDQFKEYIIKTLFDESAD